MSPASKSDDDEQMLAWLKSAPKDLVNEPVNDFDRRLRREPKVIPKSHDDLDALLARTTRKPQREVQIPKGRTLTIDEHSAQSAEIELEPPPRRGNPEPTGRKEWFGGEMPELPVREMVPTPKEVAEEEAEFANQFYLDPWHQPPDEYEILADRLTIEADLGEDELYDESSLLDLLVEEYELRTGMIPFHILNRPWSAEETVAWLSNHIDSLPIEKKKTLKPWCANCGEERARSAKEGSLCNACDRYLKRNLTPRPRRLWNSARKTQVGSQRSEPPNSHSSLD